MKRNIILGVLLLSAIFAGSTIFNKVSAQKEDFTRSDSPDVLVFTDDFSYTAGGLLTANGWTAHSGGGTNAIAVTAPGLAYTGYAGSNVGNAVTLTTSGEDVHRTFAVQSAGSVFAAVMVNVSEAVDDPLGLGGYVFHLGPDPISTTFRGRVYVKKNAANQLSFGITKASSSVASDIAFTPFSFALNTTHLLIVKYTVVAGDTNDTVSLFVNPTLGGTEPAASVTAPDVGATDFNPGSVALRQGSATTSPTLRADGIRVGTTWADVAAAAGGATPTPTPAGSPSPTPAGTPSGSTPRFLFTTRLSSAQEVPVNASTGRGFGRVVLNAAATQITASFYWEGLGSGTISGHIHTGAIGVNGPVTFNMAPTTGLTSGSTVDRVFANVTPAQVADLRAGNMYFNIHTTNFTGGEIRGQIVNTVNDAPADYNGDGRTDFSVVRPTAALGGTQARWYNLTNATPQVETQTDFGVITDFVTPGDFDGDGKDDIAVWRSETNNSTYFILQSSTNTLRTVRFGLPGDDPTLTQDYDGDGVDDPAIFRAGEPEGGQAFFWWYGSFGITKNVQVVVAWGLGGANTADSAIPGDFNGDGKADFTVYRSFGTPARGVFITHFGNGGFDAPSANDTIVRFGLPLDTVVPGDYDGDGTTDMAVTRFEGNNLVWFYLPSSAPASPRRLAWGRRDDIEVQGDYDGDGRTDLAIARSAAGGPALFFILRSSDQTVQYQFWGLFGDVFTAQDTHNQ